MKRDTRLVSIQGEPMVIYGPPECISDDIVKYNDFWEFKIFNAWKYYFTNVKFMLDLGANIGSHCVQFKHHFPNVEIWAFELDHNNFKLLQANTKRYPDVHCFNVGVGSRTSVVQYNDGHESNAGVVKITGDGNNRNIVMALDNLFIPRKLDFIKIDIEGHELSAFEGMVNILKEHRPMIWMEDITPEKHGLNYLKQMGYNLTAADLKSDDYLLV